MLAQVVVYLVERHHLFCPAGLPLAQALRASGPAGLLTAALLDLPCQELVGLRTVVRVRVVTHRHETSRIPVPHTMRSQQLLVVVVAEEERLFVEAALLCDVVAPVQLIAVDDKQPVVGLIAQQRMLVAAHLLPQLFTFRFSF